MFHSNHIRIKAFFLITVFSLSTLAGFACSVGIDLGYNDNHHSAQSHQEHSENVVSGGLHHYAHAVEKNSPSPESKDCCSNEVIQITQLDKRTAPEQPTLKTPFFTHLLSAFYMYADKIFDQRQGRDLTAVYLSGFSPHTDIRIAIQSFQI